MISLTEMLGYLSFVCPFGSGCDFYLASHLLLRLLYRLVFLRGERHLNMRQAQIHLAGIGVFGVRGVSLEMCRSLAVKALACAHSRAPPQLPVVAGALMHPAINRGRVR